MASARSAKYAGPEPETAVIASIALSGTRTTAPRCDSASSARSRCSSPACAPAASPAIPSCTVDGVFGIARTTGTPADSRLSMREVWMAAATDSTVCSGPSRPPIVAEQALDVLRLDRDDDECRACRGVAVRERGVDAVALAQLGHALGPPGGRGISPGFRHSDESSPEISASPIRPAPRIAIFARVDHRSEFRTSGACRRSGSAGLPSTSRGRRARARGRSPTDSRSASSSAVVNSRDSNAWKTRRSPTTYSISPDTRPSSIVKLRSRDADVTVLRPLRARRPVARESLQQDLAVGQDVTGAAAQERRAALRRPGG